MSQRSGLAKSDEVADYLKTTVARLANWRYLDEGTQS